MWTVTTSQASDALLGPRPFRLQLKLRKTQSVVARHAVDRALRRSREPALPADGAQAPSVRRTCFGLFRSLLHRRPRHVLPKVSEPELDVVPSFVNEDVADAVMALRMRITTPEL